MILYCRILYLMPGYGIIISQYGRLLTRLLSRFNVIMILYSVMSSFGNVMSGIASFTIIMSE